MYLDRPCNRETVCCDDQKTAESSPWHTHNPRDLYSLFALRSDVENRESVTLAITDHQSRTPISVVPQPVSDSVQHSPEERKRLKKSSYSFVFVRGWWREDKKHKKHQLKKPPRLNQLASPRLSRLGIWREKRKIGTRSFVPSFVQLLGVAQFGPNPNFLFYSLLSTNQPTPGFHFY